MLIRTIAEWIRAENMSWSFIAARNFEFWSPQIESIGHRLTGELPDVDKSPLALHAHDWVESPLGDWFERFAMEVQRGEPIRVGHARPRGTELSRTDFRAAVRNALRSLAREDNLDRNPLCAAGVAENGRELMRIATDAVEVLSRDPRDRKLFEALHATYFSGVPNQEASAERLGLPFSTYRRHLTKGIDEVDWLARNRTRKNRP
jgi:hypothetical protein